MNFGEILSQWEEQQQEVQEAAAKNRNKPRPRLPNAPRMVGGEERSLPNVDRPAGQGKAAAHPLELWLEQHGVMDKDAVSQEVQERERSRSRRYLKGLPVEARIDLHGFTREEAWEQLEYFIEDCCRRGVRKVLIVHGKGHHSKEPADVSVLSAMVRTFIQCDPRLGASGHPDKRLGGSGATWVVIKKTSEIL